MWWLPVSDGALPVGDVIYWGTLGILSLISYCSTQRANTRGKEEQQYEDPIAFAKGAINRPPANKVSVDMDHILSGHGFNGYRGPNKDRFPKWMSPALIEKAIRTAYDNAQKAGKRQLSYNTSGQIFKQFLRGKWNNMDIEMWYNITNKSIDTAWPKTR